ncbi:MAG: OmpA family protein [uncultured Thiotrichaceae bacterium]|uniref:OmpA family protein n=1 Tax=uncultured Thiotrichaceae bacterium TaxID=298394 RepID=A0A6S6STQ8_9GAMM|nr:MAG: OmpA family protein [uncultured Thiotrichaceae bacterium]
MYSENNTSAPLAPEPQAHDMQRLRDLLLGKDYESLLELRRQINTPELHSEQIARVVSEALQLRASQDETLSEVLSPTIENALSRSIESDPQRLANALYPVMGPAIRQSIQEALAQTFDTFNQLLEQSLSPKFLGWRFDAWRTGRSYSEVVLLNTLEYQVEQVFLIHSDTGLLLRHAEAPQAISKDPDMVSGMLTAIQDFIADSFSIQGDASLKRLRLGELSVLIERGPRAVLAAVVRGNPPGDLVELLTETQESIHQQMAHTLVNYEGDSEPFVRIHHLLEDCLVSQRQQRVKTKPWFAGLLLLTLLSLVAYWGYQHHRAGQDELALGQSEQQAAAQSLQDELEQKKKLQQLAAQAEREQEQVFRERIKQINAEPGVVVVNTDKTETGYRIEGLLDPLARHPDTFVERMPLLTRVGVRDVDATFDYSFQPYVSAEPAMVMKRAHLVLQPAKNTVLNLRDSVFVVSGVAEQGWRNKLENYWRNMPGVTTLDVSRLKVAEPTPVREHTAAINRLVDTINRAKYLFGAGRTDVDETSPRLNQQLRHIKELLRLAQVNEQAVRIILTGNTDQSGSARINEQVSADRAVNVRDFLIGRGVPAAIISLGKKRGSEVNERSVTYWVRVY